MATKLSLTGITFPDTTVQTTAASGGGLGGQTVYSFNGTASRATTVMTVTAVNDGVIRVGDTIKTTDGVTSFGTVSSFGTGTGGAGTYNMSASGTIASTSVMTTSATFTIPTGKTVIKATIVGGGGGSGGVYWSDGSSNGISGGGGGAAVKYLTGLTPGNTLTVTVGNGGTAGTGVDGSAGPGGVGGTSSVASGTQSITTVSATGGAGGYAVNNAGAVFWVLGGSGSNGDYNLTGGTSNQGRAGNSFLASIGEKKSYNGGYNTAVKGINYGGGGISPETGSFEPGSIGGSGIVIFEY